MKKTDSGSLDLKRIKPVFIKEVLHIVRDSRSLAIALLAPVVLLVLYAYAVTFDIKKIDLGVVDYDGSSMSRELTEKFTANGYFELNRGCLNDMEKCVEELRLGRIKMVLVIPPGMSTGIKGNKTVTIQALGDGSDTNTTAIGLGYAGATIAQFSRSLTLAEVRSRGFNPKIMPVVEPVPRVWYNPELKSINFIVPGLCAIIMMLISALLTSLTVVREREQNTFEQLVSTPLKPLELMIGKITPYILLCLIDVAVIVIVAITWFRVPFRGNIFTLSAFTVLFLFCALGLGLIISSSVKSQQMAVIGTAMGTLLPSILLSGFVFPIDSMPAAVRIFTYVVPARYFITALRTIFLKADSTMAGLWIEALYLFIFGMFFLVASAKRFRKDLE